MKLESIIEKAKRLGACSLVDNVSTWQDAADLVFSPQGQEFFENVGFPDQAAIRAIGKEVYGFYSTKSVTLGNPPNLCIAGKGKHKLTYDGLRDEVPLVLLNDSDAVITLNNYAVVKVVKYGECEVYVGGDGTGIVL